MKYKNAYHNTLKIYDGSYSQYHLNGHWDRSEHKSGYYANLQHTVLVDAYESRVVLRIYSKGKEHYKSLECNGMPSDLSLSRQASKFSKEVKEMEVTNEQDTIH